MASSGDGGSEGSYLEAPELREKSKSIDLPSLGHGPQAIPHSALLAAMPSLQKTLLTTVNQAVRASLAEQLPEILPRLVQGVLDGLRCSDSVGGASPCSKTFNVPRVESDISHLSEKEEQMHSFKSIASVDLSALPGAQWRPSYSKASGRVRLFGGGARRDAGSKERHGAEVANMQHLETAVGNLILRKYERSLSCATSNRTAGESDMSPAASLARFHDHGSSPLVPSRLPGVMPNESPSPPVPGSDPPSMVVRKTSFSSQASDPDSLEGQSSLRAPPPPVPRVLSPVPFTSISITSPEASVQMQDLGSMSLTQTSRARGFAAVAKRQTTRELLKDSVDGLVEEFEGIQKGMSSHGLPPPDEALEASTAENSASRYSRSAIAALVCKLLMLAVAAACTGLLAAIIFKPTQGLYRNVLRLRANLPLSLGCCLGLAVAAFGGYARGMAELLTFLELYAESSGLQPHWVAQRRWDGLCCFLLWLLSTTFIFTDASVSGEQGFLGIAASVSLSLIAAFILGWSLYLMYICRGLALMIDFFCCTIFQQGLVTEAIHEWNMSSAMLRKASTATELCLLTIQAVIACTVPVLIYDYHVGHWYSTVPAMAIMVGMARVLLLTGAITEKCSRVPALFSALTVRPDQQAAKERLIQHILHSQAGFYVRNVRMTTMMVVKFLYFWLVVAFAVTSKLGGLT